HGFDRVRQDHFASAAPTVNVLAGLQHRFSLCTYRITHPRDHGHIRIVRALNLVQNSQSRFRTWSHQMKQKKMISIKESRRRFIAHFSSIGLGATLVPGILWGKMQEAGAQTVSLDMLPTS